MPQAKHEHQWSAVDLKGPAVVVAEPEAGPLPLTKRDIEHFLGKSVGSRTRKLKAALRAWWLIRSWPVRKRLDALKCRFAYHDWEDAPALDAKGEPDLTKPGLYKRCRRAACRVLRDRVQLVQVDKWLECSDDFMVLARTDCPACHGRGSARRMLLPAPEGEKITAAMPCTCLRVQPRYIKREPAGRKRGR